MKPWTEAHRREVRARKHEIAAERERAYGHSTSVLISLPISEETWRDWLTYSAGFDDARIEREVRRVRALAEGRLVRETKTITDRLEAFRCDGCRDSVAEGAPRWSRTSDGNEYCKGCRRDASEHATENGATVVRVKVRVRHVTRIRRA